jgi:hypothetical protein
MGLIQPSGPSWAYCTHNLPTDIDVTALGTVCTPGTEDSDGTAVDLFGAALAHDVEYLRLAISATVPAASINDILLTVLVDPAGGTTWSVLIPFLIVGALGDVSTSGAAPAAPAGHYDFPIWIPAGATIGVQARTAHTVAQSLKVAAFAHGGNRNPASWWCGQRVTAIGITEAESTGTQHTADASGSFSTWTDLGSTLTADCGALQFGVNGPRSLSIKELSVRIRCRQRADRAAHIPLVHYFRSWLVLTDGADIQAIGGRNTANGPRHV